MTVRLRNEGTTKKGRQNQREKQQQMHWNPERTGLTFEVTIRMKSECYMGVRHVRC